jgi:DNA polymerase-3 subunit gamma/tau
MSQALYRKYRPEGFKNIVGQEHIVTVLEGALKLGNVAHAYLFAGSRGTGKTSIARIVAREIGATANDTYEIDAASNRGIDDVRQIRESVHTSPFESKYKVYIIDEAHMLTKEAWNAFLKTLEEPPEHVVFILATTELEKVPETVLSRCQIFQFKKPTRAQLRDLTLSIAKQEGFTIEASSAELIALLGDGSFRDTQGILQKVLSFSENKNISPAEVELVTGAPRGELVNNFVASICDGKLSDALTALGAVAESGNDMKVFLKLSIQKMRFALLLKVAPELEKMIAEEISKEDIQILKTIGVEKGSKLTSQTLVELLGAYEDIGKAYAPELPIELALVKILSQNDAQAKG